MQRDLIASKRVEISKAVEYYAENFLVSFERMYDLFFGEPTRISW